MLCLFTAGFQTMSIYNSPLLLVFYSLLGLRAKTPERPLVIFFFGSLKQPVYFCRLVCSTFQIKHHHPSVVFFLMFSNSLFQPFGELLHTLLTVPWASLSQRTTCLACFVLLFFVPSWALLLSPLFLSSGFLCLTALGWSSIIESLVGTSLILLTPN